MLNLEVLKKPTRFLFFTGKGGVGKTSISAAVALSLVDVGKKILLVSTDAASNLDEMLGVELKNYPVAVPLVKGLFVLNIDHLYSTSSSNLVWKVKIQLANHPC